MDSGWSYWKRLLACLMMALAACAGCRTHAPAVGPLVPVDAPVRPARGFYLGLLPTPAAGQELGDAYAQAALHAELAPVWGRPTPFHQLAAELAGWWGQTFVKGLIRGHGLVPLVHLSFIGPDLTLVAPLNLSRPSLADPAWRAAYRQAALDVVRVTRPLYLSLGNEVNYWYERYGASPGDPNSFLHYVSLYEETYLAVKALSPGTKVFCVFAREHVPEHREADLKALSLFDPAKLDVLAFTSYPFALARVNRVGDIPADYYARATAGFAGKPVGFTELGWPARPEFGGEQGQADLLEAVAGRLTSGQGLELEFLMWSWLHDLEANDTVGLIQRDGKAKLGYAAWRRLSGP